MTKDQLWLEALVKSQGREIDRLEAENRRLRDPERDYWERRARQAETPEELIRIRHQYETRRRVR